MKKSTKKLIRNTSIILVILLFLAVTFQQFTVVDTQYFGTTPCNKETGCTDKELQLCNLETKDLVATQGFLCQSDCSIKCSNTAEMMRRSSQDYANKCDIFAGGGALVEAVVTCKNNKIELDPRAKTVCADGNQHVFLSGTKAYPQESQWTGLDVYYMNDLDQLKEKKTDCSYACKQTSDTSAKCIDSPTDPDNYIKLDHKGCFAWSNRWEVWWFDSDNTISQRIEVCDETCSNGACQFSSIIEDSNLDLGDDITTPSLEQDCTFGACTEDVLMTCAGGAQITAYTCVNGCAVQTTNTCPDGTNPITSCKSYEITLPDGDCKLTIKNLATPDGILDYLQNNIIISAILGSILFLIIVFAITTTTNYKKSKVRGL